MREYTLELVLATPLHVGGERGIRPSIIDLKVERRAWLTPKGELVEKVVVPGSTLKGVIRHSLEDLLRKAVICRLMELSKSSRLLDVLGGFVGKALAFTADALSRFPSVGSKVRAIRLLCRVLGREQQIVTEDLITMLGEDLEVRGLRNAILEGLRQASDSSNEEVGLDKLADIASTLITSLLPLVCDPSTPSLSCIPDTALIDLGRDISVTTRFLLSIALLRKAILCAEVCPVCSIFGTTGRSSAVLFTDAIPVNLEAAALPLRTRVSIDRLTWAARRGRLFTLEYIPPGTVLRTRLMLVEGMVPRFINEALGGESGLVKLMAALLRLRPIGGFKSVGMGWLSDVKINSTALLVSEREQAVEDKRISDLVMSILDKYVEVLRNAIGYVGEGQQECSAQSLTLDLVRTRLSLLGFTEEETECAVDALNAVINSIRSDDLYKKILDLRRGGT